VGIDEVIAEVQPMPRPAGTGTAVYGYRRGHRGR
jgi:hypothetical protein